ncbi:hypothetical protein MSAN_00779400 [Mycena sanguinolenta]|uniref:Uncharacterized protein n=1 Tax=Mycena sanguinolenta TaxID=230812 RepID=A0A8H7DHC1_9AGAR|nr:hypothetical protein MSAN_00779400 [Mycena sanguinolenta]
MLTPPEAPVKSARAMQLSQESATPSASSMSWWAMGVVVRQGETWFSASTGLLACYHPDIPALATTNGDGLHLALAHPALPTPAAVRSVAWEDCFSTLVERAAAPRRKTRVSCSSTRVARDSSARSFTEVKRCSALGVRGRERAVDSEEVGIHGPKAFRKWHPVAEDSGIPLKNISSTFASYGQDGDWFRTDDGRPHHDTVRVCDGKLVPMPMARGDVGGGVHGRERNQLVRSSFLEVGGGVWADCGDGEGVKAGGGRD